MNWFSRTIKFLVQARRIAVMSVLTIASGRREPFLKLWHHGGGCSRPVFYKECSHSRASLL
jgi:hypothetical protein